MIKGSIPGSFNTIIYTPNIRAPKYIKQAVAELRGEIDINTKIIGAFNIPLFTVDRLYRKKIIGNRGLGQYYLPMDQEIYIEHWAKQ